MSRLEAGKAEPHREQTDVAEVLDAAREATAHPERVRFAIADDLPTVHADAAQLERAFANLLENAHPPRRRPAGPGPVEAGR